MGRPRVGRRGAVAVVAILLAVWSVACTTPPARYVDQVFPDVDATLDVVYRPEYGLRLDIYRPKGDTVAKRPAVMWQFGGFWVAGAKEDFRPYAIDSAKRGYVGVTIQYRIRSGNLSSTQVVAAAKDAYDDSLAAVNWLKANAATYGIDPGAIVTGGWSAGGINSLNLLYASPAPAPVAAAVGIAATVSMVYPVPGGRGPALIHSGTADTIVTTASSTTTCDSAKAAGNRCDLMTYGGADHFTIWDPARGAPYPAQVQAASAKWIFDNVLAPRGYTTTT